MDDGPVARRPDDLQAALRRRPDLSRRADHQLVPAGHDGDQRHRGRPQRRARRADLDPLRRRRRARSSSRRRGPRRCWVTPRSRCIPTTSGTAPGRQGGRAAADQSAHPGDRRRARRPVLRHRRGEGDAGARPERLRDRPPPRPADADDHGRARRDHRARAVRRPGPDGGAVRDRRGAARGRPHRRREAPVQPFGRALLEVRHRHRAAPVVAVVRPGRDAREGRGGRRARRARRPRAGVHDAALLPVGRQPARLVHQPPAVVGPPDPGLVLAGRRRRLLRSGRDAAVGLDAGRGRARHLVLVRAVAVLDDGLARGHRRPRALLPDDACSSPATTSCSSGSCG